MSYRVHLWFLVPGFKLECCSACGKLRAPCLDGSFTYLATRSGLATTWTHEELKCLKVPGRSR